ncbi:MAG: GMC family oxidoreductase [Bacteroidota bacterium]
MTVSPTQREALIAICDSLIPTTSQSSDPHDYWRRPASDMQVADQILELLDELSAHHQKEFRQLLFLLGSPLLGLTWMGPLKPAHKLSHEQRTRLLQKWSAHFLPNIRNGFNSLKKLTGFFFFSGKKGEEANPAWAALAYQNDFPVPAVAENEIQPLHIQSATNLACDVLVIGSGAGGSVIASEMALAGKKVLVVEKGPYLSSQKFSQTEGEMMRSLYEARAALTTMDGGMSILAGSCLGGGTTVNWAGAFRTPDYVLEEWAKEHDNPHFLTEEYGRGFAHLEKKLSISTELLRHNPQNQFLYDGAQAIGHPVKIIPRNTAAPQGLDAELAWKAQGFSPLGDRYQVKKSTVYTLLREAADHGADFLVHTEVDKIKIENGQAVGAIAYTKTEDGQRHTVNIRAAKVVVAASALHSPAILMRSGLKHPHLGKHLYFHPTVAVPALYDQKVDPWFGPMMSTVCDALTRLDGNYGCKLETPPVHPGLMSSALPWLSGEDYKARMLEICNTASFIVLTRDKFGGEVKLDKHGKAMYTYSLSEYDRNHMIRGIQEAVRIHAAAGAQRISVLHNQPMEVYPGREDVETFVQKIPEMKWQLNRYNLYTAHQMGSCRMGGDAARHPLKPNGETREVRNLFVADGSAFPAASGANPMLSIQALAYYIAQQIKAQ